MGEQAKGTIYHFFLIMVVIHHFHERKCMKIMFSMLGLLSSTFLHGAVQSSHYVTISRTSFRNCQLVTLTPPMGQSHTSKTHIREIIYVPSHVNVHPEELEENDVLNDDHFCSLLCDQGFIVHVMRLNSPIGMANVVVFLVYPNTYYPDFVVHLILWYVLRTVLLASHYLPPDLNSYPDLSPIPNPILGITSGSMMGSNDNTDALIVSMLYTEALNHVVNSRIKPHHRVSSSSALCIVAQELSCSRVLTYLADTITRLPSQSSTYNKNINNNHAPIQSSQMSQSNSPVGAVILLDPPPLLSLQANPVRAPLSILQRYMDPLHSPAGRILLFRLTSH